MNEAQTFYTVSWWYVLFPALALLITTLAFNLLGDGIRDAIDPRTERIFAGSKAARNKRGRRRRRGGLTLDQAILVGAQQDLTVDQPFPAQEA